MKHAGREPTAGLGLTEKNAGYEHMTTSRHLLGRKAGVPTMEKHSTGVRHAMKRQAAVTRTGPHGTLK